MKREKILTERIFEKLEGLFDKVIYERKHGYESNPKPEIRDIDHIIRHYSSKCAKLSIGTALIPGQWGVISAVPEIVLGMKKQAEMIYDISVAYKKDKIMNNQLLAGILLFAATGESYGLMRFDGGKYFLNQSQVLFDSAISKVAKKIARQILRSVLVRWLPGFSTVSQSLISGRVTRRIGNVAADILAGDIEIVKIKETDIYEKNLLDVEWLASHHIVIADENGIKK